MSLEERLELDIADALRGIDSIESALGSAASSFQSALTDALDVLSNVTVSDVDASAVTSSIDEAVAAADVAPVIEADASSVTDTLDAAISEADQIVTVDADTTALVSEIEAAASDTDVVIEVDADTAAAEEQISQLGEAAGGAEDGLEGVSGAAGALTEAATGSAAGVGDLVTSLASADPRAAAAAGALLGTAGAAKELFGAAVDANAASEKFNRTLGDQAESVRQVNVGGLDADLQELSRTTGASLAGLETAGARIFSLGTNSGTAAPQVADTTEQILALTTRALALNPTLGESNEVAGRLTQALGRGGRSASQFGFDLQASEIQARGAQLAGKDLGDQLSTYERIAGGASLVTERLGGKLGTDVAAGAGQAQTEIAGLQETISQLIAEAGQPLIAPGTDLLKAAVPVVGELSEAVGKLAAAGLPALTAALESLVGPLEVVNSLLDVQAAVFDQIEEVVPGAGDAITDILNPLSLVNNVVESGKDLWDELTGSTEENKEVLDQLPPVLDAVTAGTDALTAADKALTDALVALLQAQEDQIQKELSLASASLGAEGAARNTEKANRDLAAAIRDHGAASDEANAAEFRLRQSQQSQTESLVRLAAQQRDTTVAQLENAGVTVDAGTKASIYRENLITLADTVADPMRTQILGLIGDLNAIPPSTQTNINVEAADAFDKLRETPLLIAAIPDEKLVTIAVQVFGAERAQDIINQLKSDTGNIAVGRMAGGPVEPNQSFFVGEVEPEIFVPNRSGVIGNQAQLQAAFSTEIARQLGQLQVSGGAGTNIGPVIVNEVANDPQATANAVAFRLGEAVPR